MRRIYLWFWMLLLAAGCAGQPNVHQREVDLSQHFAGYDGCLVLADLRHGVYTRSNPARCQERLSPCSTFKIPNSLIGLETGVIPDADYLIRWDGQQRGIAAWNRDHTLRSAFANSVIWYYQALATRVGEQRMQEYLHRIGYGNQDISGGLTQFWLGSSLRISADEQVEFLTRLCHNDLPFSPRSIQIVKEIMIVAEGSDWVLRGKTGSSMPNGKAVLGWFVGYLTRGEAVYVFACNLQGEAGASGQKARQIAEAILMEMNLLPSRKPS